MNKNNTKRNCNIQEIHNTNNMTNKILILFIFSFLFGSNIHANEKFKTFLINKEQGTFDILDPKNNTVWLKEVTATFVCNNKEYNTAALISDGFTLKNSESTFGKGKTVMWKFSNLQDQFAFGLELTSYDASDWVTVNGWVENRSGKNITLNAIRLLDTKNGFQLTGNLEQWRVLCERTDNLVWTGEKLKQTGNSIKARLIMGLWNSETNQEAVIGFSIKHAWGEVILKKAADGLGLTANTEMDVDLAPEEIRYGEAVHLALGSVIKNMETLLTATGKEVNACTDGTSFGGWCSWYGFNPFIDNDITEDVVVGFAESAAKKKDELPLQLMLLDDGYFTLPGDWTTLRPFFPNGMKYITSEVKKNGIIPGIWIAPALVHKNSVILSQHPGWMDRLADGKPKHEQFNWGSSTYSFDISNPAVLNYIDSLLKIVCSDWGYQYLKLDFNIEPGAQRYNRSITSFDAVRNMYKTIRKAVGPGVFIANCAGSPFPPSIGIAQAGRVGSDVNPNWASVINGCKQSLLHIPFHRRWWVNDPDCLNMRKIGSQLTDDELRVHITANYMGGGYVLFSDSIDRLPEDRCFMLAQALPSYGIAAQPVNYMKSPGIGIPNILNILVEKNGEKYTVVALFNWEEKAADTELKLEELGLNPNQEYHVFDFWTDTYKGIIKDIYQLKGQKPHSCELLAIKPVLKGEIQVVSSNLHLLQGTMEITDIKRMNTSPFDNANAEIWISLKPVSLRNGKLILAAGEDLRIAAVQGGKANLIRRADGLWDLNVSDLKDDAAVLLRVR
jgi:hypothetical protein